MSADKRTPEIVEKIYNLLRNGVMKKTVIARRVGITDDTLRNWLRDDEEFKDGYVKASDDYLLADIGDVKKSALKKAKGYTYKDKKVTTMRDCTGNITGTITVEKIIHVPPDSATLKILLTNIQPKQYD